MKNRLFAILVAVSMLASLASCDTPTNTESQDGIETQITDLENLESNDIETQEPDPESHDDIETIETVVTEFESYDDIKTGVRERFLRYVTYDTQSDLDSDTSPSSSKQIDFAKILAEECKAIGLVEVELSEYGIVTATLPANTQGDIPVVGFLSHMDTAPDASGAGVVPRVHENYDGNDIVLDAGTVISPTEFPELRNYVGQTLVTASGDTLLGADDKSGLAIIMSAMEYLIKNPDIPHGKIRIAFTPDEEIGRGTENFDVEAFGVDFAFTVDGGPVGDFTYENFNAVRADIEIFGRAMHTGYAKGTMVNSMLIANELIAALPADKAPVNTEGYEAFYHVLSVEGGVEKTTIAIPIRSFFEDEMDEMKLTIQLLVDDINEEYGEGTASVTFTDQYSNMSSQIEPWIIELAERAYNAAGIEFAPTPARGGTDGSNLSFRGIPCPDIFTGMRNFHGLYEYIAVESMEKSAQVVLKICELLTQ
ncbi:MAG: peptidase T [Oscillospiraceae bacterium]|nr:peptidase T [Oscillospiraceae bacterium]